MNNKIFRIIFAGSSEYFSVPFLQVLINSCHIVQCVLTKSQKPYGRGQKTYTNKIKKLSEKYKIQVYEFNSLKDDTVIHLLMNLKPDIIIVVAYGIIFPVEILNIPKFGCINIHGSLLPKWRGSAPIQRCLLAGENKTGITIIKMNTKIDSGKILSQEICDVELNDTACSLSIKLIDLGCKILLKTLSNISKKNILFKHQNDFFATYAKKVKKEEAKLLWSLPAIYLERCIRAFNPWPISYFFVLNKQVKVFSSYVEKNINYDTRIPGTIINIDKNGIYVLTKEDILVISLIQLESRNVMLVKDFLNSNSNKRFFSIGDVLK